MCMMKRCLLRLGCLSCSFLQGMTNINHSWLHHWQHSCTFVCALFCTEQSVVCFCQAVIGSILNSILWSHGRRDPHQDMVDSDVASIVWFDPSVKCSNVRCSLSIEPVVIPSHVEMAHPRECGRPHEHSAGLLVGERCNIWHCLLGTSKWYKRQPAQKSRRSSWGLVQDELRLRFVSELQAIVVHVDCTCCFDIGVPILSFPFRHSMLDSDKQAHQHMIIVSRNHLPRD